MGRRVTNRAGGGGGGGDGTDTVHRGQATDAHDDTAISVDPALLGPILAGAINVHLALDALSAVTAAQIPLDTTGFTLNLGAGDLNVQAMADTLDQLVINSPVESVNDLTGIVVLAAADVGAVGLGLLGQPDGVATLDSDGILTLAQWPDGLVTSVNGYNGSEITLVGLDIELDDSSWANNLVGIAPNLQAVADQVDALSTSPLTGDLTLDDGVIITTDDDPGAPIHLVNEIEGGVIRNVTSLQLHSHFTMDGDPIDSAIGTAVFLDLDQTLDQTGPTFIGPQAQPGGYGSFGVRGYFGVEGHVRYAESMGPLGYTPNMSTAAWVVRNKVGSGPINLTPAWIHSAAPIYCADGEDITLLQTDATSGSASYMDTQNYITADGGTIDGVTNDIIISSLQSVPFLMGNTEMFGRAAVYVQDVNEYNPAGGGHLDMGNIIGSVPGLDIDNDTTASTLVRQAGLWVKSLEFADENYSVYSEGLATEFRHAGPGSFGSLIGRAHNAHFEFTGAFIVNTSAETNFLNINPGYTITGAGPHRTFAIDPLVTLAANTTEYVGQRTASVLSAATARVLSLGVGIDSVLRIHSNVTATLAHGGRSSLLTTDSTAAITTGYAHSLNATKLLGSGTITTAVLLKGENNDATTPWNFQFGDYASYHHGQLMIGEAGAPDAGSRLHVGGVSVALGTGDSAYVKIDPSVTLSGSGALHGILLNYQALMTAAVTDIRGTQLQLRLTGQTSQRTATTAIGGDFDLIVGDLATVTTGTGGLSQIVTIDSDAVVTTGYAHDLSIAKFAGLGTISTGVLLRGLTNDATTKWGFQFGDFSSYHMGPLMLGTNSAPTNSSRLQVDGSFTWGTAEARLIDVTPAIGSVSGAGPHYSIMYGRPVVTITGATTDLRGFYANPEVVAGSALTVTYLVGATLGTIVGANVTATTAVGALITTYSGDAAATITTGIGVDLEVGEVFGLGLMTTGVLLRGLINSATTTKWGFQFGDFQSYHIGKLSLGSSTAPTYALDLKGTAQDRGVLALTETANAPTNPSASNQILMYMKADTLVFSFNDAGTMRYLSIVMTGTGVTWTHSTSAI